MKITLSAIFTEARNLGLYEGVNPTTGVRIPKGKKHGRKRLAYSLEEILKHLQLFNSDPIVIVNEDGPYTPEGRGWHCKGGHWGDSIRWVKKRRGSRSVVG
jgi:hypothetical protein